MPAIFDPGSISGSSSTTISDSSGDGSWASGLTGMFTAIGTQISNVYRSVNSPTQPVAGQLVYNPATGTYQAAGYQGSAVVGISSSTLLLLFGVVVVILLVRK